MLEIRQIERVSRALAHEVPRQPTFQMAAQTAMRLIQQAVPCHSINLGTVDLQSEEGFHFALEGFLMPPERIALLPHFKKENPMLGYARKHGINPPLRFTDFKSRRQFEETGIYRECYRGYTHSMVTFGIENLAGLNISVVLSRADRDFSDRECSLLGVLQPLIASLLRGYICESVLNARHQSGQPVGIVLGVGSYVQYMDSHAASLWQHLQPERHRHLLPAVCERLLQARCLRPQVLLQLRAGVQLWGKMELSDATWRLHLWQQGNDFEQKALSRLGMTGRQSEVLSWVAAGKTNVEIGLILGISSRTVQKHLETIYRLLGVETRVAAINRCRELAAGS